MSKSLEMSSIFDDTSLNQTPDFLKEYNNSIKSSESEKISKNLLSFLLQKVRNCSGYTIV